MILHRIWNFFPLENEIFFVGDKFKSNVFFFIAINRTTSDGGNIFFLFLQAQKTGKSMFDVW